MDAIVWVDVGGGDEAALTHRAGPGEPVVLCHGISSNARFWDLAPDRSLADWLVGQGYDVWNLDLRGHGVAERGSDGKRQRAGWSVDDYGNGDLPAVFDAVRMATGASKVHYVGHSMGGMVLAVYLAGHADPPLASAVVAGSPLDFRDPDPMWWALLHGAPFVSAPGFLPTPLGARALGLLGERAPLDADEFLYARGNVADVAMRRAMLRTVVSPLSRGEIKQFGLAKHGEFVSADGAVKYRESLGDVTLPMLFLAGRADRVVTPDRVWGYYEAVGSAQKDFFVIGDANGAVADYGHLDFGDGDRSASEVYPLVGGWLAAHPAAP